MPMPRVAVLDDYQDLARNYGPWERLDGRIALTTFTDHLADEGDLAERLAPFEAIVAMRERTPFGRSLLECLPNLELLITTGMANAAIDLEAAKQLGVTVSGTTVGADTTAELTWGLVIALVRHICEEDRNIRAGGWQRTIGPELAGATLGLIGLGRIGKRIAAYGAAFAMEVIAWSQNLEGEYARSLGVEPVTQEELFERADVLSVHTRLSDRTRGLIGARELAQMKPTAYLINTSRGPIVEEAALLEALHARRIAGAALDVFDIEPLPLDHPLRSTPNTLLTPHIGYVGQSAYEGFYRDIVEDLEAWLARAPARVLNA